MAYDLLIKNGRIVDGSGMPAFRGDVGVKDGKIAEIGKLSGPAARTVDAEGRVVAPGFIDNHCHYDAQVTWDPLCSFSCDHGATTRDLRQLLAVLGAGAQGQGGAAVGIPLLCRSDPDGGAAHPRIRLGDGAAISRPARPSSGRQRRQPDRPHRGALLRDGRGLPEAHRHRRRNQTDAGSGARRHESRAHWGSRCRATRATSTRRACISRHCGPTRRRSLRSATCCASSAPASSNRAAATAPR